jgi:hypothetical protein
MSRSPDPELRRRWRRLIDSFDPHRQTVAEFCNRHEVSPASFYAWRRRLSQSPASSPAVPAFLPVEIMQRPLAPGRSVQVHLPGGVRVEVPTADRDLLFELIGHVTPEETSP